MPDAASTSDIQRPRRLCLDTMRGYLLWNSFLMFGVMDALSYLPSSAITNFLVAQFNHTPWHGFHYADGGYPGFIIIIGASMVFSYTYRIQQGWTALMYQKKAFLRALIFLVGAFLYEGGFIRPLEEVVFTGLFSKLAFAMLIASWFLRLSIRNLVIALLLFLLTHWCIMVWVPPGHGAGLFSEEGNVYAYLKNHAWASLPAQLGLEPYPALAKQIWWYVAMPQILGTCIIGVLLGRILQMACSHAKQALLIAIIGIEAMALAVIWNQWLPINKPLWTPSYTLFSAGFFFMILSVIMAFTELFRTPRFTYVLLVFGRQPLLSWLWFYILPYTFFAERLVGIGFPIDFGSAYELVLRAVRLAICWLTMAWLYERRVRPRICLRE